jgi:predicted SAM-dependent methyltransferase
LQRTVKAGIKKFLGRQGLEVSLVSRHKRLAQDLAQKYASKFVRDVPQINLELGAGPVKGKNGWLTIDFNEGADLTWDLNLPLPFPDESVCKIYSSHLLEHFFYRDLVRLLADCHRVLKRGGSCSVCVPDASIYVRAYMDSKAPDRRPGDLVYEPAVISDCKMDWLNYIAYMDGHHRYMFDTENLLRVLRNAGFSDVESRSFDPALDMAEREHESIYAVGLKS